MQTHNYKKLKLLCVDLTPNPLWVRHWYKLPDLCTRHAAHCSSRLPNYFRCIADVFCHVCLHSNFDISFAISDVDFKTNEKVDISENMFL